MAKSNGPGKAWYRATNKHYAEKLAKVVRNELQLRPDLLGVLKEKAESFIVWAGRERLDFVADLDEEVKDFLNKEFNNRKRIFNTNVKEWKRITKQVFERDQFTCHYCGQKGGILECDHVVPFSQGGSDEFENLVTACRKCNRSKRDKSAEEFKEWLKKISV